jgi:hypothetical protein
MISGILFVLHIIFCLHKEITDIYFNGKINEPGKATCLLS